MEAPLAAQEAASKPAAVLAGHESPCQACDDSFFADAVFRRHRRADNTFIGLEHRHDDTTARLEVFALCQVKVFDVTKRETPQPRWQMVLPVVIRDPERSLADDPDPDIIAYIRTCLYTPMGERGSVRHHNDDLIMPGSNPFAPKEFHDVQQIHLSLN